MRPAWRRSAALVGILVFTGIFASADSVQPGPSPLPQPLAGAAYADHSSSLYLLGGWGPSGLSDQIIAYNPSSGSSTYVATELFEPVANASAATYQDFIFIFGGSRSGPNGAPANTAEILLFRPLTGQLSKLQDTLPDARNGMAVAAAGDSIFLFGGLSIELFPETTSEYRNDILHFDPAYGQISSTSYVLPSPRAGAAAAWTGTHVFLFGGQGPSGWLQDVVRFDPNTGSVQTMQGQLPQGIAFSSAVHHNGRIYLFGGDTVNGPGDMVLRYDPAEDKVTSGAPISNARSSVATQSSGDRIHLLGGRTASGAEALIERYVPGPDPTPVAEWTHSPSSPKPGDAIAFTDNSQITYGSLIAWHWEFGDGATSGEANPTHTYSASGDYMVSLRVQSENGLEDIESRTLRVSAQGQTTTTTTSSDSTNASTSGSPSNESVPEFGISASNTPVLQGVPVWFNATGEGDAWSWAFGDGNVSTGRNVTHAYERPGQWNVVLTVHVAGEPFATTLLITVVATGDAADGTPAGSENASNGTDSSGTSTTSGPPSAKESPFPALLTAIGAVLAARGTLSQVERKGGPGK